jgi:hypothetical protein
MKKILCIVTVLAVLGGMLSAQENTSQQEATQPQAGEQPEGGEQTAAQGTQRMPGMPEPKPNVMAAFGMGNLRIDGMILTGIGIKKDDGERSRDQATGEWTDSRWRLGFLNPAWEENRFELDLHYDVGQLPGGVKFGWFATLWAQNYGIGNFTWAEFPIGKGGRKMTAPEWNQPWVELRYAGLWTSFLDDKIKTTFGRTYDEFYYMPGSKVWKTEGFPFRFTDEKTISARFEFKPIEGLNFGFQWFGLVPYAGDETTQTDVQWPKFEDAIKEIGVGVQYQNSLVNFVGGVRFDGNADPMSKDEAKTYLSPYYGEGGNSIRLWKYNLDSMIPAIPGLGSVSGYYAHMGPYYKHLDEIMEDPDHFADGTWAFFSFRWKGTPKLSALAYGAMYNITAFDKFGYGRFGENIGYDITPKLNAGITFEQEFYGSDVFPETFDITTAMVAGTTQVQPAQTITIVNSPYFKFSPAVTYKLSQGMGVTLEGSYGVCVDVLEFDYSVKPSLNIMMGVMNMTVFYQFSSQKFKSDNPQLTEKLDVHKAGIGLMVMF